jgi:hypothetical protein
MKANLRRAVASRHIETAILRTQVPWEPLSQIGPSAPKGPIRQVSKSGRVMISMGPCCVLSAEISGHYEWKESPLVVGITWQRVPVTCSEIARDDWLVTAEVRLAQPYDPGNAERCRQHQCN